MEKKKLLLIAVSVGVFLVIVIGACILVVAPKGPSPAAAAVSVKPQVRPIPVGEPEDTALLPASVNAVELVKNSIDITGLQTPPEAGKQQENVFYIYGENPNETVTVDRSTTTSGNRLIVDVPRPTTAAVPNAPRPAARTSAPAAAPARQPTAAPSTVASVPSPSKARDNYWVQTGSFSTKVRAEGVRETLSGKGITSLIENREVEGKTYFRVRVGPYTSKNEADYWLALIKSINGFEESQVWKSPAK
ncbi:sporulation repeat domain protein [Treponema primitia ZAS-2]|uniref:Sporulation repeat domain protein n=1 Tax=Treponema primitia (strain ATCC BAA-887 / DSM 12427 / ZAS-2) TaxID=545694 RepID=F5YLU1_TREPZ|nr:SPOR domain-containing protein [Treponema primitia]AEF84229.1 sporulation repeat domain protein [Treponema primitia ZAS-2]